MEKNILITFLIMVLIIAIMWTAKIIFKIVVMFLFLLFIGVIVTAGI